MDFDLNEEQNRLRGNLRRMMEYDIQRHYRDARSITIAAGTSQMQHKLIAKAMGLNVK